MKVKLSIRKYISWIWFTERNMDIRKEYKRLSDIPDTFLPKSVFVDETEYNETVKICSSSCSEEGMDNISNGRDIYIEWIDDFDYEKKILKDK